MNIEYTGIQYSILDPSNGNNILRYSDICKCMQAYCGQYDFAIYLQASAPDAAVAAALNKLQQLCTFMF